MDDKQTQGKHLVFSCYRTTAWTTAVAVGFLKSLPYSILAHVRVKTIKDSVQQVLALYRGCIYPKSRVIAYKFPRYFLRFASIGKLILGLISNIFIFRSSLTVTLG